MPLFRHSTATCNIRNTGKAGFCIQRNVCNARKKVRKKVRNKRVERNEREKYATNVADVVDGTAVLITENCRCTQFQQFTASTMQLCKRWASNFSTCSIEASLLTKNEIAGENGVYEDRAGCVLFALSRKTEHVATLERLINICIAYTVSQKRHTLWFTHLRQLLADFQHSFIGTLLDSLQESTDYISHRSVCVATLPCEY